MSDTQFLLFSLLCLTVLGTAMFFLFLESRFPRLWTAVLFTALAVFQVLVLTYFFFARSPEFAVRIYVLAVHVPDLIVSACLSRNWGWRMLFQLLSCVLFCSTIHQGAALVYTLTGRSFLALLLSYLFLASVIFIFLIRCLLPLSRQVFPRLHRGWWLMCLLLAGHFVINIYVIPGWAGTSLLATALKPAISLLMVGVYVVFLYLFFSFQREIDATHQVELSALELSSFRKRMETIYSAEEAVRLARHDQRHWLQAIAALARRGDTQAILEAVGGIQQQLEESTPPHWCQHPILDAVFSLYFSQAEQDGIQVQADIHLPNDLPAQEGELAIVFANALENALRASHSLPMGERRLICKVIARPSLMIEIANPVARSVAFDSQGLPKSEDGHGLGTRSIAAFCQKYGFLCQFSEEAGWFRLRVIQ